MEGEKAYRYGWVCGRVMLILAMAFVVCELCAGCGRFDISDSGEKLVYDVCDDTMLPEELSAIIERKKEKPFNMVYSNRRGMTLAWNLKRCTRMIMPFTSRLCSGRQPRRQMGYAGMECHFHIL